MTTITTTAAAPPKPLYTSLFVQVLVATLLRRFLLILD